MIKIENLVRPNILTLQPYSSARNEFSGKEGVFLDANENPYGSLNRYPDPLQKKLKEKLSILKNIPTQNIFVGNGSDEVIDLAYRIFCNPELDKALTFTPTYGMYSVSAAINNVKLEAIPLNEDFQIEIEKVKPYLADESIKLIFICSPNNPTGNMINQKDIEYILANFNGIVIIDEAYIDFSASHSLINLIDNYNNVIISQTFSKAWGLAGIRVGLAYANEEIISFYNKIKPPYNISELNQSAAIKQLDSEIVNNTVSKNIRKITAERERLILALNQLTFVTKIYQSDANFILIEFENANEIYFNLLEKKIITRNRVSQVKNCLRITVGTQQENNQLINALKNTQ